MSIENIASVDMRGLEDLKSKARTDAKAALPEVAKQFEAVFLSAMLKSMRMKEHFLDKSSPFISNKEAQWQDLLDTQYASNIAQHKGIGLAEYLAKHLDRAPVENKPPIMPVAVADIQKTEASVLQPIAKKQEDKTNIDDFIQSIWPYARKTASALGLDPKILVAQAALETGWGQFVAKDSAGNTSNNLFNIKARKNGAEDAVQVKTTEYIANTPLSMKEHFRKYASIEDSFDDYLSLIKNNDRYQNALHQAHNPEGFMKAIHKAGYATDPQYSNKILSIYHGTELQKAIERCGLETD